MKSSSLFVMALLMPSLLGAAEMIKIDSKIFESAGHEIPHDFAKAGKIMGLSMLMLPSVIAEADQEQESVIYRELRPKSVLKQGFTPARIGTRLSVTPSLIDGKIAFAAILTVSEMVGEKADGERFQTEVQSRAVYFSAIQKNGEEGWFDLVDPGPDKNKKVTVWIRFNLLDREG